MRSTRPWRCSQERSPRPINRQPRSIDSKLLRFGLETAELPLKTEIKLESGRQDGPAASPGGCAPDSPTVKWLEDKLRLDTLRATFGVRRRTPRDATVGCWKALRTKRNGLVPRVCRVPRLRRDAWFRGW